MCLRHDRYMYARRGFTHHNCSLLYIPLTALTLNNQVTSPDALWCFILLAYIIMLRGLLNKQKKLGDLLSNCSGKEMHIATINETWLKNKDTKHVNIQGYDFVGVPWPNKKGGGVRILINTKLRSRILSDLPVLTSVEYCAIEVKFVHESIVVSLYRSPSSNVKTFLQEYDTLLCCLWKMNTKIILGCDHNLDLLKCLTHKNTELFVDLNLEKELIPCIMKPTRITKTTATLIDNVFVSANLSDKTSSSIVVTDISDHLPCKVTINDMFPLRNKAVTREIRKITKQNVEKVKKELNNADWSFLTQDGMTSTNEKFNKFDGILSECTSHLIPSKKIHWNDYNHFDHGYVQVFVRATKSANICMQL